MKENIKACPGSSPLQICLSKVDTHFFCYSANPHIPHPGLIPHSGLIPQSQTANFWGVLVTKSQIRKFVMINLQIAIRKFLWCPSPQIRKFARKNAVIQIRIGLPLILYFLPTYVRYILDYKMPCYSVLKLSQKPSLCLNEIFKLIFVRRKIMYLRISGSNGARKSQIRNLPKI